MDVKEIVGKNNQRGKYHESTWETLNSFYEDQLAYYHESTWETLNSFYEDQLAYWKERENRLVNPQVDALHSVVDLHPDFAFNGDKLDHATLKMWIEQKEEQLFEGKSNMEEVNQDAEKLNKKANRKLDREQEMEM